MELLRARFRIVTPMFIAGAGAGADQSKPELRPASIKGALRFWWRALNWAPMRARAVDDAAALRALHEAEARLFGIAVKQGQGGQGCFLLSLHGAPLKLAELNGFNVSPIGYLAGQGLHHFNSGFTRKALAPDQHFELALCFKPSATRIDRESIADALYTFGLLGSLGSRARHGFGSVALEHWEGYEVRAVPKDQATYAEAVAALLAPTRGAALPPYSAFSGESRIDLSFAANTAVALLRQVGGEQQLHRSFGQKGLVNGQNAERNFRPDHDLIRNAIGGIKPSGPPVRAVFGLPHNYFFSSIQGQNSQRKADINYKPNNVDARRASPLLLHCHYLPDALPTNRYLALHMLLKADFLPAGAQISIKTCRGNTNAAAPSAAFAGTWQPIETYLNRFAGRVTL